MQSTLAALLLPLFVLFMALLDLVFLIRNRLPSRSVFAFTTLPVLLGSFFGAGRFVEERCCFAFLFSLFTVAFASGICNSAFGIFSENRVIRRYHLINSLALNLFSAYLLYAAILHY